MNATERRIRQGELLGFFLGFDRYRDAAVRYWDDGYRDEAFGALLTALSDLHGAVKWLAEAERARQDEEAASAQALLEQGRLAREEYGR